ncbi:hypothetical protein B0H19DRAFT_1066364 [Mycena capillaripes]|nr:hypothetical protein B0H19DRAFT_1086463 [Mycena capillaripes]KAJ6532104.1 hypothetical protein B0H19DRAFT_1081995 [Mycena capillaripes]KAJ6562034.1 hypothetical protein B0H19DRAFT_1068724 [Mycena capillaripes]KAJ6569687.1 hypothetical protein B0H19DRAFT_1066364 [Mycena capillaripes]
MVAMRIRPTGTVQITGTAGRAFLFTDDCPVTIAIKTETKVPCPPNTFRTGFRINKLPYLVVQDSFTVTQAVVIHDTLVHVGKRRFLVSGYYRPTLPINEGLKEIAPGFAWRGEIIVVALGKRVPYLAKVDSVKAREAANQFMTGFLSHYHMKREIPSGMVC